MGINIKEKSRKKNTGKNADECPVSKPLKIGSKEIGGSIIILRRLERIGKRMLMLGGEKIFGAHFFPRLEIFFIVQNIFVEGIHPPINFLEEIFRCGFASMPLRKIFLNGEKFASRNIASVPSGNDMIDGTRFDRIERALRRSEYFRNAMEFIMHDHGRSSEQLKFDAVPDRDQDLAVAGKIRADLCILQIAVIALLTNAFFRHAFDKRKSKPAF